MCPQTNYDLARYRLDKAEECLDDAKLAFEHNALSTAANRSYYCIFHAMRAVLALDEFDSKKHSGIISAFNQRYVKTGIFPKSFSEISKRAFMIRGQSDYDDFYLVSKSEVEAQIKDAQTFLDAVKEHIG